MSPIIKVKDGGVHIITGEDDRCECGIDVNGQARDCHEILQDLANRFIDQYRDGKVPNGPILLCEDTVAVTDTTPAPDLEGMSVAGAAPGTAPAGCPSCPAETAGAEVAAPEATQEAAAPDSPASPS